MGWRDIERGIVECKSLREQVGDGQRGQYEMWKNKEGVKQESVMFGGKRERKRSGSKEK